MNRPDPWGDAVSGIPEDQWDKRSEQIMNDLEAPVKKGSDDPAWQKAGAITMGICTCSIVVTVCLVILKLVGVI